MRPIASLAVLTAVAYLTPAAQATRPALSASGQAQADALPIGQRIEQFVLTPDGHRTYFTDGSGVLWMYDRATKLTRQVIEGPVWNLTVSVKRNAIAYTKAGAHRGDQFVYVLSLDGETGLARGSEQCLSTAQGDAPSVSPDGKLVAFARDEANGVGQSVVVTPISGGHEKIVAPNLPSSVANIRWTPDGTVLFVGVNPPVGCVPEWSCLPFASPQLGRPTGSIRRVRASGGPVVIVTEAMIPSPGLSPDGTTLLFLDGRASPLRTWTIAAADGRPRASLTLAPAQTPVAWLAGSTVIVTTDERGAPPIITTLVLSAPSQE